MEAFGDLLRIIFVAGVLAVLGLVVAVAIVVAVVLLATRRNDQRPSDRDERLSA